jgi:hypothetical protein
MKRILFLIISCPLIIRSYAQEADMQRLSDDLVGFQDANADYEDAYENLAQILSSPYDLNAVSVEELQSLHILNDQQIGNFMDYRNSQGNLLDVYELQVIPDFDLDVISKLKPYVMVRDPAQQINHALFRRIFSKGHSFVVSRYERTLEKNKGFLAPSDEPGHYEGSPYKLYLRFRSNLPGDFSVGFTGEKDAGEKFVFDHSQYGFDFSSVHLQVQNKGKLKNIILGDFQTQFAQGLILGGAFGLGKGAETVSTVRRSNVGFLPYTSINESAFLRGIAFTFLLTKNISLSAFFSDVKRDASQSQTEGIETVSSFQTTGYHRTPSEIENRKKVSEHNYGIIWGFQKNQLEAGVIINALTWSLPVIKTPAPYNQFAFEGTKNVNAGIYFNYRIQNFSFFSETAQSIYHGRGVVAGLLINTHKNFDVSIVYRKYGKDFYTFYANAFSENTLPQNEGGFYWGWKYRWNRKWNFTGYADLFTFPWLGFRRYAPSNGYECLLRASYQPTRKTAVFLQVREESKCRNLSAVTNLYETRPGVKRNAWLNCDYGIGEKLKLKSRIQHSSYLFEGKTSEGLTLIQDVSFSVGRFQFTARHALFDTDNYDNRQYAYENDAWLSYSLPAYAGVGVRNYVLIEYTVLKQLTIWLRYARTRVNNQDEIGSGQDAIEGNTKNDVKFQARIKF